MTPQALNIHTGFNFRDLGGYRTADGRIVAPHRLIRAASLDHLDATDSAYLTDYGMSHVVDFRSLEEKNASPDRIPEGVTYLFDPVFSTDETLTSQAPESLAANFSTDPNEGREHLTQTYADLVRQPSAQKAFRAFFDVALGNNGMASRSVEGDDSAVLFHCTVGKDRTGMAAAFMLSALGVDDATIRADYLATNDFMDIPKHYILSEVKSKGGNETLQHNLMELLTASDAYLDSALTVIATEFGGMAEYLRNQLGLDDAQQSNLKALYLR